MTKIRKPRKSVENGHLCQTSKDVAKKVAMALFKSSIWARDFVKSIRLHFKGDGRTQKRGRKPGSRPTRECGWNERPSKGHAAIGDGCEADVNCFASTTVAAFAT